MGLGLTPVHMCSRVQLLFPVFDIWITTNIIRVYVNLCRRVRVTGER